MWRFDRGDFAFRPPSDTPYDKVGTSMTAVTSQLATDPANDSPSNSAVASSSTSAAIFKRLHPSQYLSRFLAQGYRPDGRKTGAWRDLNVNVGRLSAWAVMFLPFLDGRAVYHADKQDRFDKHC